VKEKNKSRLSEKKEKREGEREDNKACFFRVSGRRKFCDEERREPSFDLLWKERMKIGE